MEVLELEVLQARVRASGGDALVCAAVSDTEAPESSRRAPKIGEELRAEFAFIIRIVRNIQFLEVRKPSRRREHRIWFEMRFYPVPGALIMMVADTQSFDAIAKRGAHDGVNDIPGNVSVVNVELHRVGDERRLSYGVKARRSVTTPLSFAEDRQAAQPREKTRPCLRDCIRIDPCHYLRIRH